MRKYEKVYFRLLQFKREDLIPEKMNHMTIKAIQLPPLYHNLVKLAAFRNCILLFVGRCRASYLVSFQTLSDLLTLFNPHLEAIKDFVTE